VSPGYARRVAPLLVDTAPRCVLAVYAHPDDPEIACGGTLARWARAGAEVHVLLCTRGEKGSLDPKVKPAELARRRAAEVTEAAKVLGLAGHEQLRIGDGDLDNTPELRRQIVTAVRRVRPEAVVCPDPTAVFFGDRYFNHHDHREVGWAALDAVSPAASNPHYFPNAGPVHKVSTVFLSATLEPNAWVDIGETIDVKVDALACHKTQLSDAGEWFRGFVKERAEEAGRIAGVIYAEGFRRLSLEG
jgi:LmbE family N-acetylglucosaminyl deacetylase